MFRILKVIIVFSPVLFLAGCGGGGGGSTASPPDPGTTSAIVVNGQREAAAPGTVSVSWTVTGITGAAHFGVDRRIEGESVFTRQVILPATQRAYTDTIPAEYRYRRVWYQVTALDAKDSIIKSSDPWLSPSPVPSPPEISMQL